MRIVLIRGGVEHVDEAMAIARSTHAAGPDVASCPQRPHDPCPLRSRSEPEAARSEFATIESELAAIAVAAIDSERLSSGTKSPTQPAPLANPVTHEQEAADLVLAKPSRRKLDADAIFQQ